MITFYKSKKNPSVFRMLITIIPFLVINPVLSQAPPNLIYTPIISSGLTTPVDVVNANDGTNRLFIACKGGQVRIVQNGTLVAGNFLDVSGVTGSGSEYGLLSIAFHPNYVNNGYVFTYYIDVNLNVAVRRYQSTNPTSNTPINTNTGQLIMTINQETSSLHNGGKLNFGPDGNLYFGLGDGSQGQDPDNHAQNGNLLWGKMVRINVDNFTTPPYYTIPAGNPYIGDPNVRDEIFAIGLRNPWRWSFDRSTGDVWLADVGEGNWEEVNRRTFASSGGINYGWRCYEGNASYNSSGCGPSGNYVFPIFTYDHSANGGHSITGGYVYRGTEYAAMHGYYFCADFINAKTWMIKPNGSGGWTSSVQTGTPSQIVGFGESENGAALYAISYGGTLYKVTTNSGGTLAANFLQFTGKAFTGFNELRWKTTNEQNLAHYVVEYSSDGTNYDPVGIVAAINNPSENNYIYQHTIATFTKLFYRIKIVNKDGSSSYSNIISLENKDKSYVKIYPTLITGHQLNIVSEKPVEEVIFFSSEGKSVFESKLNSASGTINMPLPNLQKGFYFVRVKLKDEYINEKVLVRQ